MAVFGTVSYMAVRRAALGIGQQRLVTLTQQLSTMFQQSARKLAGATQALANQPAVVHYLEAPDTTTASGAQEVLRKSLADPQTVRTELLDLQGRQLLSAGNMKVRPDVNKEILNGKPDSNFVGGFYPAGDSIYAPLIATVTRDKKPLGYLIRWQPLRTKPKDVEQFTQLIGAGAVLYFGNSDGSFWTNLLKPVAAPPLAAEGLRKTVNYKRPNGEVIAFSMPIGSSKWIVRVELSQGLLLETATRFLYWMIGLGVLLIITGSFIAWLISRNFTRPLNHLMRATAAIAAGDYSSSVTIHRKDEIGNLADSFNSMTTRVRQAQENLESKVRSRTEELEAVNRELEAFSYSVSHDLRAPLRAVSGYAMMLKEDYEDRFDDEAKRITDNILSNVKMMGRLIDDLIAFSRLGKREVKRNVIDMKALAEGCVAELSATWPEKEFDIAIGSLPDCRGDSDLLKQVWLNLIGNAMKYSSKKTDARIFIGASKEAEGTVYHVRDNGAGFDMKYADKLFKVFQRLHSQDEFEGTGVGLALVKRILDKHRGTIRAESSPGQGAVFYFELPNDKQELNFNLYAQSSRSIAGRGQYP
ncbi:hypothetical protein GCM10011511_23850 [Puia dinghuensis]|uniref:histidine kinase n=2 Tax=Puia dinghuensis TaxID=1792502 RepID=A0A8J2UD23_9BACT|nr:hypothetical protein GCM10011511_23850 [Puia dinghuensis]